MTLKTFNLLVIVFYSTWLHSQSIVLNPFGNFEMKSGADISAICFSSDGKLLLVGNENGNIECWDLKRKLSIADSQLDDEIIFLSFLSGDKFFVSVNTDGVVIISDLINSTIKFKFHTKNDPLKVTIDQSKKLLAIATDNQQIELFNLKVFLPYGTIDCGNKLNDLLFIGYDRLAQQIVAITKPNNVVSWNLSTQKILRELTLNSNEIYGSRSIIYSGSTNRGANIFVVGLEEVALPKGGLEGPTRPNDLVREYMLIAFDLNSGMELKRVKLNWLPEELVIGPGNDQIIAINKEVSRIEIIDLRKGEIVSSLNIGFAPKILAISEDNSLLGAGSNKGKTTLWEIESIDALISREPQTLPLPPKTIFVSSDSLNETVDTIIVQQNFDDILAGGKYYALIIGINSYSGEWRQLKNPINDTKKIREVLNNSYRFDQIITLYDSEATRKEIIAKLDWLTENLTEKDNLLIYFAGHGYYNQKLQKGYWVPFDAVTSSYISNSDVQTYLAGIPSKHTLLITDACFAGDIFRGSEILNTKRDMNNITKYYSNAYGKKSRLAITSGGVEPVTDDGIDNHSVFAYYLIKALQEVNKDYFDVEELFNEFKVAVGNNAKQTPLLQPIKDAKDEGGKFIFFRRK